MVRITVVRTGVLRKTNLPGKFLRQTMSSILGGLLSQRRQEGTAKSLWETHTFTKAMLLKIVTSQMLVNYLRTQNAAGGALRE